MTGTAGGTAVALSDADVAEFARASGDANPLHTDADYARRTPYGRPIGHGALSAIVALGALPAEAFRAATSVTARFSGPVLPGTEYRLERAETRRTPHGLRYAAAFSEGGAQLVTVTVDRADPPGAVLALPASAAGGEPAEPEIRTIEQVMPGLRVGGRYQLPSEQRLRALADRLGAVAVPTALLAALGWASYFVGMRLPGRDAVFSTVRIKAVAAEGAQTGSAGTGSAQSGTAIPGRPDPAPRYEAVVRSADPVSGAVATDIAVRGARAALDLETLAFLRPAVPPVTRASLAAFLPGGNRLERADVLVVGGSRGIGAALSAALAAQGATVWAVHTGPSAAFAALRAEFGAERLRGVFLDAADPAGARRAARILEEAGVVLDGLVLSAGPPVPSLALHPDTVARTREFVDASLAMVLQPLTHLLGRVAADGWVAAVSSSAVEDTPRRWPHYVTAKFAVEGLVTYYARASGRRALIARAPRMWTDLSNGPAGHVGAVPAERVAAAIVSWALDAADAGGPNPLVLSSAALAAWRHPAAALAGLMPPDALF